MTTDQAVADFGKAATAIHTLLHESVGFTNLQLQLITTELYSLEVALKAHYPKWPGLRLP
jgi:hypothetical protein